MTAEDIARDYPHLSADDQASALEVMNTSGALMKLAVNDKAYPNADVRKMLGGQVAGLRSTLIQMLGQK